MTSTSRAKSWRSNGPLANGRTADMACVKCDNAAACLVKQPDTLRAFYDFPAEHGRHMRIGSLIESAVATVRHRKRRHQRCLSHETAGIMVFN